MRDTADVMLKMSLFTKHSEICGIGGVARKSYALLCQYLTLVLAIFGLRFLIVLCYTQQNELKVDIVRLKEHK